MPPRPRLATGGLAYHVLNRRVGRLGYLIKVGSSPLLALKMSCKGDEAVFMAHLLRIEYPVGYCHFMNRSHSRGNIFLDNKRRKRFFDLRSDNSRLRKMEIYAPET